MSRSASTPPAIDAASIIADLRELEEATSGPEGAERLCWSEGWRAARALLVEKLAEVGAEVEIDEAGNLWARIVGTDRGGPAVAVGSHLDSVPAGGWLDGALGVMAGLGVLRSWAGSGIEPPRDLILVDFADEEGARFGRSLFGSSALAGTLDPGALSGLRDGDGASIEEVLAANGVDLARVGEAATRLEGIGAYLELHIEQGPVLEAEGTSPAAVSGCAGVERQLIRFRGQSSHAGTTPMDARRDATLAAAETALAIERIAIARNGVATTGSIRTSPGIATAVAGSTELLVDLRHPEAEPLADMLSEALGAAAAAADGRRCVLGGEPIWRIAPIHFDPALVEVARKACAALGGRERPLPSGALHDAAEIARRVPAAMIFCASREGISHAREEDTSEADLRTAIEAFGRVVGAALEGPGAR